MLGAGQPLYLGATFFYIKYPIEFNDTRPGATRESNNYILIDLINHNIVNQSYAKNTEFQLNSTEIKAFEQSKQQNIANAHLAWANIENSVNSESITEPASTTSIRSTSSVNSLASIDASSSNLAAFIGGVPPYLWKYGCVPTSAAMVLGYWENLGLTELPHVTDMNYGDPLNYGLSVVMHTNSPIGGSWCILGDETCGFTSLLDATNGINNYIENKGILGWHANYIDEVSFTDDQNEINNGYPFELLMTDAGSDYPNGAGPYHNHAVAVIGYNTYIPNTPLLEFYNTGDKDVHYFAYGNWGSPTFRIIFNPLNKYSITATAGSGGTISAPGTGTISSSGTISVLPDFSPTFTITPNNGYIVDNILVDGKSTTLNPYTFPNVMADHTISATFKKSLPAIVPLCPAGAPFDASKYAQGTSQSDPMVFSCNWDGNGEVYISGDESDLTGVDADDGFTITIEPSGAVFDAQPHYATKHDILDLTSGMTPGANTFTLVVQNWQGLSMSYAAPNGGAITEYQTPYIIEVNGPVSSVTAAKMSTVSLPSFIAKTSNGLMINGTLVNS